MPRSCFVEEAMWLSYGRKENIGKDVIAQFEAFVLQAQRRQDGFRVELRVRTAGELNAGAV